MAMKKIRTGSVFQKAYKDRHGKLRHTKTWYLKYYVNGKSVELPAETEDYDEALATLRQKMAQTVRQAEFSTHPERVRMDQLFDLLLELYRKHQRRSTYDVERKMERHLRPWWGKVKAQVVGSTLIARYTAFRRSETKKPENATINRELAYVRRAMKLGEQQDPPLVLRVPHFEMLPEDNVREGMLTHEQYRAIRNSLPQYARIAFVIAYHTEPRKGEIRKIEHERIDL